jgi:hypothetical protein
MKKQTDESGEHFDFVSWSQPDAKSLGWGFRLLGNEITGWTPHRIQVVDLPGEPRANLSVWRPVGGGGQLLAINVFECDSARAARFHLLHLLGEINDPAIRRVDEPGDVAFVVGFTARLFARDNHVAVVRSIERTIAPLAEIAGTVDGILAGQAASIGANPPRLRALRADSVGARAGEAVPLHIDIVDPTGPAWVRLDTPGGSFHIEHGEPVFVPAQPGSQTIRVRIAGPGGTLDHTLRFDASSPESQV